MAVEDALGRAGEVAPFEPVVVVGADPGQEGDLFAAQPLDASGAVGGRQPDLLRGDPGPPGGEELTDLGAGVHPDDASYPVACS